MAVRAAIDKLERGPDRLGVKRLRGIDAYRLRVGSYRVLFEVEQTTATIVIVMIGHRKDVYRHAMRRLRRQ